MTLADDPADVVSDTATSHDLSELAARLGEAMTARRRIVPFARVANLDVESAYRVQQLGMRSRLNGDGEQVGWKIGLTEAAAQRRMGSVEPVYGYLLRSMVLADGAELPTSRLIESQVEVELAMVLWRAPDPTAGRQHLTESVWAVGVALEVIDPRIASCTQVEDLIADNAASAFAVVGRFVDPRRLAGIGAGDIALRADGASSEISVRIDAAQAFENLSWLVRALHSRGLRMKPGDLVLTGAQLGPVTLDGPCEVAATLRGSHEVSVRFVADDASATDGTSGR